MDQQQIKAFIDAMAASDLAEMEVSHDGWTLRLVRHGSGMHPGASVPAAPSPAATREPAAPKLQPREDSRVEEVRAPMYGVVHLQQAQGDPPFVKAGVLVEAGQMLCTLEAMKVFHEVRSERAGRVAAVLVTSGAEVEAGQPLITIERVGDV